MIFAHYREVVRPDEAEKFIATLPGDAASLEAAPAPDGNAMAPAKRNGENRGSRIATKAALSPQGRFREHLREVDGLLDWNSFPEKPCLDVPASGQDLPIIGG